MAIERRWEAESEALLALETMLKRMSKEQQAMGARLCAVEDHEHRDRALATRADGAEARAGAAEARAADAEARAATIEVPVYVPKSP